MTISGAQSKAARGLLNWTRDRLAGESGLSPTAISRFEDGKGWPTPPRLSSIVCVLEDAGVEFIPEDGGAGVTLRKMT
jgi:transcriptional regulator with XRE-family HTH domain